MKTCHPWTHAQIPIQKMKAQPTGNDITGTITGTKITLLPLTPIQTPSQTRGTIPIIPQYLAQLKLYAQPPA